MWGWWSDVKGIRRGESCQNDLFRKKWPKMRGGAKNLGVGMKFLEKFSISLQPPSHSWWLDPVVIILKTPRKNKNITISKSCETLRMQFSTEGEIIISFDEKLRVKFYVSEDYCNQEKENFKLSFLVLGV